MWPTGWFRGLCAYGYKEGVRKENFLAGSGPKGKSTPMAEWTCLVGDSLNRTHWTGRLCLHWRNRGCFHWSLRGGWLGSGETLSWVLEFWGVSWIDDHKEEFLKEREENLKTYPRAILFTRAYSLLYDLLSQDQYCEVTLLQCQG